MFNKCKIKLKLLQRYGARCLYCRRRLTFADTTIDHYVPRKHKTGVPYNLRPACLPCNRAKADLTVREFRLHIIRLFFRMVLNPFWSGKPIC